MALSDERDPLVTARERVVQPAMRITEYLGQQVRRHASLAGRDAAIVSMRRLTGPAIVELLVDDCRIQSGESGDPARSAGALFSVARAAIERDESAVLLIARYDR